MTLLGANIPFSSGLVNGNVVNGATYLYLPSSVYDLLSVLILRFLKMSDVTSFL